MQFKFFFLILYDSVFFHASRILLDSALAIFRFTRATKKLGVLKGLVAEWLKAPVLKTDVYFCIP